MTSHTTEKKLLGFSEVYLPHPSRTIPSTNERETFASGSTSRSRRGSSSLDLDDVPGLGDLVTLPAESALPRTEQRDLPVTPALAEVAVLLVGADVVDGTVGALRLLADTRLGAGVSGLAGTAVVDVVTPPLPGSQHDYQREGSAARVGRGGIRAGMTDLALSEGMAKAVVAKRATTAKTFMLSVGWGLGWVGCSAGRKTVWGETQESG